MRREDRANVEEGPRPRAPSIASMARGEREDAEARGAHQPLLAAGDGGVDAPGVHLERHRADGGDAIDEEERVVEGRVEFAADGGDVGGHAGRVSLWVTKTALISPCRSRPRRRPNSATGQAAPHGASIRSTTRPMRSAISAQRVEKSPCRAISTRSPGDRRLVIAASQAAEPEPGISAIRASRVP